MMIGLWYNSEHKEGIPMKKIISIVLIIVMAVNFIMPSTALTAVQANHNYAVIDVLNILKHLAGMQKLTNHQIALYDLTPKDAPGANIKDALEILKHLASITNVISGVKFNVKNEAASVVRLVNIERAKVGAPPLSANNDKLNAAAQKRADEIVISYRSDHTRPDGRPWSTVFAEYGITYRAIGENIAAGQKSAKQVVQDWMDSKIGHKENILDKKYTHIGVGVAVNENGRVYWSQLFWCE